MEELLPLPPINNRMNVVVGAAVVPVVYARAVVAPGAAVVAAVPAWQRNTRCWVADKDAG